jgi:hypothetical protein
VQHFLATRGLFPVRQNCIKWKYGSAAARCKQPLQCDFQKANSPVEAGLFEMFAI